LKKSNEGKQQKENVEKTAAFGKKRLSKNFVLKACIFATGLAGIVAEYVISTLASYLMGNTVIQWTLIVSLMLFAMGVGSRISRYIRRNLLDAFVIIEFALSVLCAVSTIFSYYLSAYIRNVALVIYPLAAAIGVLIGLEIPLATRLNDLFEELRVNISTVMEKDYYGALLGGVLFAFVALPHLGLTYTPIILGSINFLIAIVLFYQFRHLVYYRKILTLGVAVIPVILIGLFITAEPIVLFGEQQKYKDRVIFQKQTPYQRIVVTQWRDYYWLYLNGNEQFSSYDEERYHEPLVHPAMVLSASRKNILILGGGDGLAAREVLKYPEVQSVVLVDIDPIMTDLGKNHALFIKLNQNALNDPRVKIVNTDAYIYLKNSNMLFDVIIVDLPDPKSVDLARLYTLQFYQNIARHLIKGGTMVTQATSPFFAREAFLSILKSVQAAGLPAIAYHNHIPTLGEWAWVLGVNSKEVKPDNLKNWLSQQKFDKIETRLLSQEAMISMINFGKQTFRNFDKIKVNDELDLAVFRYYRQGTWELY